MSEGTRGGRSNPGACEPTGEQMGAGCRGGQVARAGESNDPGGRRALLARALSLSWASIAFGLIAGSVSVASGLAERSLGVLAAGLSVLADVTGSVVLVWRFRSERSDPVRAQQVEARAAVVVACALGMIAAALAFESISALVAGSRPGSSPLTLVTAAVSIVVLAPLAYFKRHTALRLSSHALRGDSALSAIGALTAVLALVGLALYHAFGWWWADRVVALSIAGVAIVEARTVLRAGRAGDRGRRPGPATGARPRYGQRLM